MGNARRTCQKSPGAAALSPGDLARLKRLADVLAFSPDLQELLGGDVTAVVSLTPTGGVVFAFEPAHGVSGS